MLLVCRPSSGPIVLVSNYLLIFAAGEQVDWASTESPKDQPVVVASVEAAIGDEGLPEVAGAEAAELPTGEATDVPISEEAVPSEAEGDEVSVADSVAVEDGSAHVAADATVDVAVGEDEETPLLPAEVVVEADEGALDANDVDNMTMDRAFLADTVGQPIVSDSDAEAVSERNAELMATSAAEVASEPAVELDVTPEPKTKQSAEVEAYSAEPLVDVVAQLVAEAGVGNKPASDLVIEEGPTVTEDEQRVPATAAEVSFATDCATAIWTTTTNMTYFFDTKKQPSLICTMVHSTSSTLHVSDGLPEAPAC